MESLSNKKKSSKKRFLWDNCEKFNDWLPKLKLEYWNCANSLTKLNENIGKEQFVYTLNSHFIDKKFIHNRNKSTKPNVHHIQINFIF